MNELEFWTDAAMLAISEQGITPAAALYLICHTEEFKQSGISKEDLWESILKKIKEG